MKIQNECRCRGITRLCHFTQSRNLAHILGDCNGILSTRSLRAMGLPYSPTDEGRHDRREHLICCSLEFPNAFYFANARGRDRLFKDWVVLMIKPDFLWQSGTEFCPTNAATAGGTHIRGGYDGFISLFADTVPGTLGNFFKRSPKHLQCAPTNIQAEVLVPDPIPVDAIMAIAVENEEQASKELCRARLQGLSINKGILVAPDFYQAQSLAHAIQSGNRVKEPFFNNGGNHGQ